MLIEKEIISPGQYWYTDEATGLPRKLDVTPDLTKYWHEQGSKMLSAGLTIPVPYEHDFTAHPMTPKDKLLNNAGWVSEYRLKDNKLFGVVDIQDENIARRLPTTIRWTSPWINSFTDGQGTKWNNVISHLALTTRPRITKQAPFGSIAAALSMASETKVDSNLITSIPQEGLCLSRAGKLGVLKSNKKLIPRFPIAFSLMSGVVLGEGDFPPKKGKKPPTGSKPEGGKPKPEGGGDPGPDGVDDGNPFEGDEPSTGNEAGSDAVDLPPLGEQQGDVSMEEVLCDLLRALGVNCEHSGDEGQFKRNLYAAAMKKVHDLTNKGMNKEETEKPGAINKDKPPGTQPTGQPNPLIQQEQQPMYMSLEDINKLPDPMRGMALAMYNDNVKANAKTADMEKTLNSLRDAKLSEENTKRQGRVALISRISPRVKADLETMLANPSMALSMGDGGSVVDPMAQTLAVLEKGLSDIPRLLTSDSSSLSVQAQPSDAEMSQENIDQVADSMARMMGCAPEKKAG